MAKNKSRLGRGLNSLLGMEDEEGEPTSLPPVVSPPTPPTTPRTGLFHVELSRVSVNPHQPRREFEPTALRQLADSLATAGLIQPVILRPVGDRFELIAGERRYRAALLAGLDRLPAIVRETSDVDQAQMALVENIHRQDLNPIERAIAYRHLLTHLGITQEELARRLNEERSSVANFLRLLELSEPVRQRVVDGVLSMGHAKLLAGIHDVLEQRRLADLTVAEQLSVRNLERIIQSGTAKAPAKAAGGPPTAHIVDLEKRLSRDLQMRCQVKRLGGKGKGRLVIHYGSLDQFDELLVRLGVKATEE